MAITKWHVVQLGGWLVAALIVVVLWRWADASGWTDPAALGRELEPYRTSWYGLLLVVAVFVLAELFFFPVLVLIVVCGIAFGPWLGTIYALAGSVASAIPPFFIGRWLGRKKLLQWGGKPAQKLVRALEKKGVIAVFLVRKVPAPFTAVNMICGASGLALRDFVIGTALGMVTGIVLIVVVGANLPQLLQDPKPSQLALALGLVLGGVGLTVLIQRLFNRRLERQR